MASPVDRVIDGNEVKTFNLRVKLMTLVDEVYNFKDAPLLAQNPIPVVGDDGAIIGAANVYIDSDMYADISIDYQTQERFEIQQGMEYWAKPDVYAACTRFNVLEPHKPISLDYLRVIKVELLKLKPCSTATPVEVVS